GILSRRAGSGISRWPKVWKKQHVCRFTPKVKKRKRKHVEQTPKKAGLGLLMHQEKQRLISRDTGLSAKPSTISKRSSMRTCRVQTRRSVISSIRSKRTQLGLSCGRS